MLTYGGGYNHIYDPSIDRWGPRLTSSWFGGNDYPSTILPDGRILAAGGTSAAVFSETTTASECADDADCASAHCVDGVCCDKACTGSCEACDVPGKVGTCATIEGAPHGDRSCGGFACGAKGCLTSCVGSADCAALDAGCDAVGKCVQWKEVGAPCAGASECLSGVCSGTPSVCASPVCGGTRPLPIGAPCGGPGVCASGLCVDGRCCEAACAGACEACDVTGSEGKCTPIASGSPRGARSCAGYACSTGACLATCASDDDCASGSSCDGGACVAKVARGGACATDGDCLMPPCVDGVCCQGPCNGTCEACDVPGKEGTCALVTGKPRGARACTGVATGTTCGDQCDGRDSNACHVPPALTPCSAASCVDGVETHPSTCDGAGKCGDIPRACAPYACGAGRCLTSCASPADCAKGFTCDGKDCVPDI